jgi:SEC-C motif-containing protein
MSLGMEPLACPCGAASYDGCCGPLHRGEAQATTAEQLMRSRFSAYALEDTGYVWRTWHPRTRPDHVASGTDTHWTRLEIIEAEEDVVEFRAHFDSPVGAGVLHERSRFVQRAGRWFYLDGEVG